MITERLNRKVETLTRARLAALCGIGPETLLYYEKIGLLAPPLRGENGYRLYEEDHVARLRFITAAKGYGFTLKEIRKMLDSLEEMEPTDIAAMKNVLLAQAERLSARITALAALRESLVRLADNPALVSCGIMNALFGVKSNQTP